MDSPNTKISSENWSLVFVSKFIAERIITCQCTNENPGNSLTKRDFRLQSGNLVYKMRFSFTKRDSWVTNGTLALHFTDWNPCGVRNYKMIDSLKHKVYTWNCKIDFWKRYHYECVGANKNNFDYFYNLINPHGEM